MKALAKKVGLAAVFLLMGHAASAMPHDQPSLALYSNGSISIGLVSTPVDQADYCRAKPDSLHRCLTEIYVCKDGRLVDDLVHIRQSKGLLKVSTRQDGDIVLKAERNLLTIESSTLSQAEARTVTLLPLAQSGVASFELDWNSNPCAPVATGN